MILRDASDAVITMPPRAPLRIDCSYSVAMAPPNRYPVTPDGRYFVVAGRLWRCSDPHLPQARRAELVKQLMTARRDVGRATKAGDANAERRARDAVDAAKRDLGERGPVWWDDGAPDLNRRMVKNTPYARWHAALEADGGA